jgi:hypothetical protein
VYQEAKYQKFVNHLTDKREKDEQEKRAVLDKSKDERPTISNLRLKTRPITMESDFAPASILLL